jgi:hypothetical protein
MDWILDLLTTCTQNSELRVITAQALISTHYKSPQHPLRQFPACCVFNSCSLTTASNSGDSSASRAQVLLSHPPVQKSCQMPQLTNYALTIAEINWTYKPSTDSQLSTQSNSKLLYELWITANQLVFESIPLRLTTTGIYFFKWTLAVIVLMYCWMLSQPQGYNPAGSIRLIKKSNELIGNRTRDLSACSIVPQPTTLPRASPPCPTVWRTAYDYRTASKQVSLKEKSLLVAYDLTNSSYVIMQSFVTVLGSMWLSHFRTGLFGRTPAFIQEVETKTRNLRPSSELLQLVRTRTRTDRDPGCVASIVLQPHVSQTTSPKQDGLFGRLC